MRLNAYDRQDLASCAEFARLLGYENLTIHSFGADGSEGPYELVLARRRDEAWTRWAFARMGDHIIVWSAVTGADLGPFSTMAEAIRTMLVREPAGQGENH